MTQSRYTRLTAQQKYDLLTKDFLERDGDTFVRIRQMGRLGWEDTLPKGTAYSALMLNPKSPRELYNRAVDLATQTITAMNTPFKVRVRIDPTRSCTDSRSVYVATKVFDEPDMDLGQKLDTFLGLAVHEGSHLLYTDFSTLRTNRNRVILDLQNIFEDERIERLLGEHKPGLANYLKATKYYYFGKYSEAAPKEQLSDYARLFNAILSIVRYPACLRTDDAFRFADELLQVKDILTPYPETTADAMACAVKVYDIIKKYIEKEESKKSRQNSQMTSQGQSDEDQQSGDSESNTKEKSKDKNGNGKSSKEEKKDGESGSSEKEDDETDNGSKKNDKEKDSDDNQKENNSSGSSKEDPEEENDNEKDGDGQNESDPSASGEGEDEDSNQPEQNSGNQDGDDADENEENGKKSNDNDSSLNTDEDADEETERDENEDDREDEEDSDESQEDGSGNGRSGQSGQPGAADGPEEDDEPSEPLSDEEIDELLNDILDAVSELSQQPAEPGSRNPLTKDDASQDVLQDNALIAKECEGELEIGHYPDTIIERQPANRRLYDDSLRRVRRYIPTIAAALRSNGTQYQYTVTGCRTGLLDTNRLCEARQGVQNVYVRKGEIKCDKINIALVIDESGSMSGLRAQLARDTAVLVNEAAGSLPEAELYIYGYSNNDKIEIFPYREGNARTDKYVIGSITDRGGTPTAEALMETAWRIRRQGNRKTIILVISDGMANYGWKNVRQAVNLLQADNMQVIGISIASNLDKRCLQLMYDHWVDMSRIDDLAHELGKTVKAVILKNAKRHIA